MSRPAAVLESIGGHLPPRIVHNQDLPGHWGVDDAWVRSRTGIATRHYAADGTTLADLGVAAGRHALVAAGNPAVDAVVLATSTPDRPMPATAPVIAARLGLGPVPAFDLAAVCSGFVYSLAVCQGLITAGLAQRVLLVAADVLSRLIHRDDGKSGPLLADGAGAVLLRAGTTAEAGALLAFDLGSDGTQHELITVRAGGTEERCRTGPVPDLDHAFSMAGRDVFQRAVVGMSASTTAALGGVGWPVGELDRLVPHQANARILTSVADRLELPADRVVRNVDRCGNTGAATIPLALVDAVHDGLLRAGHTTVLTAFGGGLTWGSVALRWPRLPDPAPLRTTPRTGAAEPGAPITTGVTR